MVIKGRSRENDQRKFVGRREEARANREAKEPQRCSRTGGVSASPQGALDSTKSCYYSHFSDEESETQRLLKREGAGLGPRCV